MSNLKQTINDLGVENVMRELNLSRHSINKYYVIGTAPPKWFSGLKALGDKKGVEIKEDCFHWNGLKNKEASQ